MTGSAKPSMFMCFIQVHTNACNFLIDVPIDTRFTGNIVGSFGIYCVKYGAVIGNHYKITMYTSKIGQNFYANMEGFTEPWPVTIIM